MPRRRHPKPHERGPPRPPEALRHLPFPAVPAGESPLPRLLSCGPSVLTDPELLAVLLDGADGGGAPLDLAREVLHEAGGLARLVGCDLAELQHRGLGAGGGARLLAAVELGRRLARSRLPLRLPRQLPASALEVVARYLSLCYLSPDQEVAGALFTDRRRSPIGDLELFRGVAGRTLAEPRVIFKTALLRGAHGLLLFHTHTGAAPIPSAEDLLFTRRTVEAAQVLGVELIDHLILSAGGRWLSLREEAGG